MCKKDLALNEIQRLMNYETKANHTRWFQVFLYNIYGLHITIWFQASIPIQ